MSYYIRFAYILGPGATDFFYPRIVRTRLNLSYYDSGIVINGDVQEKKLSNEKQQHLNSDGQPLADGTDECRNPLRSQTPYKRLKEVFQALAATGFSYERVIRHPDDRIEIINQRQPDSETQPDSYSNSAAIVDKAFESE